MSLFHITRHSDIPLMGCLYFGVVDRGSNLLQIRPSCGCNLNCPFCSVDAGPHSQSRVTDYQVELDYLMEAVEEIAPFKGPGVECHIDSPGEPMLYPDIVALVERLKQIKEVSCRQHAEQRHPSRSEKESEHWKRRGWTASTSPFMHWSPRKRPI